MREAGDVCYADVFRDGTGVVEFVRKEDMTYAVRKLDNTKFRSHEVRKRSERKVHEGVSLGLHLGEMRNTILYAIDVWCGNTFKS